MSILACDRDPVALGIQDDRGRWDLAELRSHLGACRPCATLRRAFAIVASRRGGQAGRGASKRRGDSDYYRDLALRSWNDAE